MCHLGSSTRCVPVPTSMLSSFDRKSMMIIVTLLHCHIVTHYQVCANILENAKEVFQSKIDQAKKVIRGKSPGQVCGKKNLSTDLLIWKCNWHQNIFCQMQQYASNPQALQVLKRSSSSTSNSPLMVKKSCVIKSGLGRPNTDLILVNKAGRPVSLSLVKSKKLRVFTL